MHDPDQELNDWRALWQAGPPPRDPDDIVRQVAGLERRRRWRTGLTVASGVIGVGALLLLDLRGAFAVPGLVPSLLALGLVWEVWRERRRLAADAAAWGDLAGPDLLAAALERAKAARRVARLSVMLGPLGILIGVALGPLVVRSGWGEGANWVGDLEWVMIAGAALLLAGVVLAAASAVRRANRTIADLEARRRALDEAP